VFPTTTPATIFPTTAPATVFPTTAPATIFPTTAPATVFPTTTPATVFPTTAPATVFPTTAPATEFPTSGPVDLRQYRNIKFKSGECLSFTGQIFKTDSCKDEDNQKFEIKDGEIYSKTQKSYLEPSISGIKLGSPYKWNINNNIDGTIELKDREMFDYNSERQEITKIYPSETLFPLDAGDKCLIAFEMFVPKDQIDSYTKDKISIYTCMEGNKNQLMSVIPAPEEGVDKYYIYNNHYNGYIVPSEPGSTTPLKFSKTERYAFTLPGTYPPSVYNLMYDSSNCRYGSGSTTPITGTSCTISNTNKYIHCKVSKTCAAKQETQPIIPILSGYKGEGGPGLSGYDTSCFPIIGYWSWPIPRTTKGCSTFNGTNISNISPEGKCSTVNYTDINMTRDQKLNLIKESCDTDAKCQGFTIKETRSNGSMFASFFNNQVACKKQQPQQFSDQNQANFNYYIYNKDNKVDNESDYVNIRVGVDRCLYVNKDKSIGSKVCNPNENEQLFKFTETSKEYNNYNIEWKDANGNITYLKPTYPILAGENSRVILSNEKYDWFVNTYDSANKMETINLYDQVGFKYDVNSMRCNTTTSVCELRRVNQMTNITLRISEEENIPMCLKIVNGYMGASICSGYIRTDGQVYTDTNTGLTFKIIPVKGTSDKNYIFNHVTNNYVVPVYTTTEAKLTLSDKCYPFTIKEVDGIIKIYDLNNNMYVMNNCNKTYNTSGTVIGKVCNEITGIQENPTGPPILTQHTLKSCNSNL
jgi:hypothetical protein